MKIVVDKDIPLIEECFSAVAEIVRYDGRKIDAAAVKQADVLIVRSVTTVNRELLHASNVRYVATITSGTDHIDLPYLHNSGIGFADAKGANARSVAGYVLSSLFVLAEQAGLDLTTKTVAIIGYGHIGTQVHSFLQQLGIECLVSDPPLKDRTGGEHFCRPEDVYSADIISLHVPLEKKGRYPTWRMIDSGFLGRLKQNVILINTSRGDVVDEKALLEFLAGNQDAGVVLDVWQGEPEINADLLARVDIGTAHIAGYSLDSKLQAVITVYKRICEYFHMDYNDNVLARLLDNPVAEIVITPASGDLDALQMAVLASYDVRTDSSALRQVLDVPPGRRGEYFDELRSNYRIRREFNALQVNLPAGTTSLADRLAGLGFRTSFVH